MCKYCERKKKTILTYSNALEINEDDDLFDWQQEGIRMESSLVMEGNMMSLSGASWCDRDDDRFDEDDSPMVAYQAAPALLKIQYCPFCGRKLNSGRYEEVQAAREIDRLTDALSRAKEKLDCMWYGYVYIDKAKYTKPGEPVDMSVGEPNYIIYPFSDARDIDRKSVKDFDPDKCKATGSVWSHDDLYTVGTGTVRFSDEFLRKAVAEGTAYMRKHMDDEYWGAYDEKLTDEGLAECMRQKKALKADIKRLEKKIASRWNAQSANKQKRHEVKGI